AIFHASRFAYFWMTIGLFAAVALGIAVIPIGVMVTARSARLLSILVGTLLLVRAVPAGYEITRDTISNQRQTLAFIGDNFPEDATGFHPPKKRFFVERRSLSSQRTSPSRFIAPFRVPKEPTISDA